MSEDDAADDGDWFERALTEGEERPVDDDREDPAHRPEDDITDAAPASDVASDRDDAPQAGEAADAPSFDDGDPDRDELDAAFEEATAAAADEDADETAGESAAGDTADADLGSSESDEQAPFAEKSGGIDDDAFGGGGEGEGGDGGGGDFGIGLEEESGGGDLFEDDFASAFGGGGGDEEFDDASFDSAIPRIDVGIEGLDRMIQGGIPQRHLITAIGGAGTGKTTFGLQYLNHGLERDQNGVFITLEQSHDAILDTAAEHGFDFETHEAAGNLAVVDLDPVEMANSLDNIRGELPILIEEFGADRFVLDSVSLLEMMYDEQARRRMEIFDFTRSLKRAGVTTLLTSEASENNPYASRHGIIEYLTDAVFFLQYVRGETNETRLAVEIQKIRNANHSRETKPYEITAEGISVYEQANIF